MPYHNLTHHLRPVTKLPLPDCNRNEKIDYSSLAFFLLTILPHLLWLAISVDVCRLYTQRNKAIPPM